MAIGQFMPRMMGGKVALGYEVFVPSGNISGSDVVLNFSPPIPAGLIVFFSSVTGSAARNLTGVTVNSTPGVVVASGGLNANNNISIGSYNNVSGTVSSATLTFNSSLTYAAVVAVLITGLADDIADDTDINAVGSGGSVSKAVTIDVASRGIAFAAIAKNNIGDVTWSGAQPIHDFPGGRLWVSVYESDTAVLNHTMQANWPVSTGSAMVAASWS